MVDSNNHINMDDNSTIITMTNMDDNDKYELVIPDVCTYFKIRFPDVNQVRVKKNMLIGMEYFNAQNSAEELRNILAFTSYHNGHLIAKVEFNIESETAVMTYLQIAKKGTQSISVFFNIILLYLFDVLKKTDIQSQTLSKKHNILCHSLFEKSNSALTLSSQSFVQWLVPSTVSRPIQYNKLIAQNDCKKPITKHFYSLKESIGICARLKKLNIQSHVNKKAL